MLKLDSNPYQSAFETEVFLKDFAMFNTMSTPGTAQQETIECIRTQYNLKF